MKPATGGRHIMKLATTTADFTSFFKVSYMDSIKYIHDAGFRYIDIGVEEPLVGHDNWREDAKRLLDYAESLGMKFVQAHSPDGNAFDMSYHDRLVEITDRSIELCHILGIPNIVVHSGWDMSLTKEESTEKSYQYHKLFFPTMEKYGVNVLIENTSSKNLAKGWFKAEDMLEFLRYADHPLLHAVWDTGHANTEGTQYEQLVTLGKELYGVHVHDNSGRGDEHTLPYLGTLNMDDLINGLIDANYKGYFTFEVLGTLRNAASRHGKRHVFERDKRLLNPSLEMQLDLERLLYTVGKYCLNAYDIFEE